MYSRIATAFVGALGTFAWAGGLLAAIAWARSVYPLLSASEAVALAGDWFLDAAIAGAPIALGIAVVLHRSLWLTEAAAIVAVAAILMSRGVEPTIAREVAAPAPIAAHEPPVHAPNLVLVTIDTLRADHLDVYGYVRPTAPTIAALARDAVLFETAISAAPATELAMASLLTGLWPVSHADPSREQPEGAPFLRSGFATLAERLAAAGYATGAFVANSAVRGEEGFAQGFDAFDDSAAAAGEVDAVLGPALAWLATVRAPFFLWLHVMDPHHPYAPPEPAPWEDASAAALRAEWAALPFAEQTARLQAVERASDLDPTTRAFLVDRYDAEILHVDRGVARLLAALEQRGATRANTWIALTADHGEEFLDHGRLLHGHTLFDELLHVPLIVRAPDAPTGLRVAAQVPVIDVAATLLDAAGQPTGDLDARSLAPFWRSAENEPRAALASRDGKYLAWRTPSHKLVVPQQPPAPLRAPVSGIDRLQWMARTAFDRVERPKGGYWPTADEPIAGGVAAGAHAEARQTEASLAATLAARPARDVAEDDAVALDPAAIERLRALGYAP